MNPDNRTTLIMIVSVLLLAGSILLFGKPNVGDRTVALLQTTGMTCGSCSQQITQALNVQPGIAAVTVDVPAGLVEIQFDARQTSPDALAAKVSAIGFPSTVAYVQPLRNSAQPAGIGGCKSGGCGNCDKKQAN